MLIVMNIFFFSFAITVVFKISTVLKIPVLTVSSEYEEVKADIGGEEEEGVNEVVKFKEVINN